MFFLLTKCDLFIYSSSLVSGPSLCIISSLLNSQQKPRASSCPKPYLTVRLPTEFLFFDAYVSNLHIICRIVTIRLTTFRGICKAPDTILSAL